MHVYMIINDANGKYYVGKTIKFDLPRYLYQQFFAASKGSKDKPRLYNAIRKYGTENFRIHSLISTLKTNEELCHWETELIGLFCAQVPKIGYNISNGGDSGTWPGKSEQYRGHKNAFFGRKHKPETIATMSAMRKGKPQPQLQSPEARAKARAALLGHTTSKETREKISRAKTGKTIAKLAGNNNPMFGTKRSPEWRTRQSEMMKRVRAEKFWSTRKKA